MATRSFPKTALDADLVALKSSISARLLGAARGKTRALRNELTVAAASAAAAPERNVHAVGVGYKKVEGKATKERCIRLYVVQKLPKSMLGAGALLPAQYDGVPTDVIESEPASIAVALPVCSDQRRARRRPVGAGISAAQLDVTAGTIACLCRSLAAADAGDGPKTVYALSNNHILANVNRAAVGDAVLQPSRLDGGVDGDADRVARLHRFVPLDIDGGDNAVDAAIARFEAGVKTQNRVCSIGKVDGLQAATEGLAVRKHGRTSGYSEGQIDDIAYDALVGMDHGDPTIQAQFKNQLRISKAAGFDAFALGGDSGSLIVAKAALNAVGLYFAGPPSGSYGVANPIQAVFDALEIELLP